MLFVICILCAALALWLAATLFLWHRELLEIQKALEDIGAGNLNRRIVTRGPQAIRSIGYGINKIVQQSQRAPSNRSATNRPITADHQSFP